MGKKIEKWDLKVVSILPEESNTVGDRTYTHTAVDFTDEHTSEYPSDFRAQVAPVRYKLLHGLQEGDRVEITATLTGNSGKKGVFMKLQLLELKIIEKASGQQVVQHSQQVSTGAGWSQPVPQPHQHQQPAPQQNQPAGFYPQQDAPGGLPF